MPIANVVVQTIVRAMMNAAAALNTGRQRAASQSRSGNNNTMATTVAQGSRGRKIINPLIKDSVISAAAPSMTSRRGGGSRIAEPSPISSGATVTIPSASDVNQ